MAASWMQRLEAARRRSFVGRGAEQELFAAAVAAAELPFLVLHLYGPGGVGKTTLLRQFVQLAQQRGVATATLDARAIDNAPDQFIAGLAQALGLAAGQDPLAHLHAAGRTVILVDTYELLRPLDGWLRDSFLPQLSQEVLVVLAGRHPPGTAWREDPAWQQLTRALPLRNLSAEESRAYLGARGLPEERHARLLGFTHGHPLALSLVADLYAQRRDGSFEPEQAPDVIKMLLERLVDEAPGPLHRMALEASAMVRLTHEPLLAALLDQPEARAIFDWLRSLSFMDADEGGIFPHDLAREALAADVRWRNPTLHAELHRRARAFYAAQLPRLNLRQQSLLLGDYVYLHRENPLVRPYFTWEASGLVFSDHMQPGDRAGILAMAHAHEGPESAALAAYWLERAPEGVRVVREQGGQLAGALIQLAVERTAAPDRTADPMLARIWEQLQQLPPLQPDETATLFRFWMARDGYQAVSPVQTRLFMTIVQHYLTTPRLAYTFLPCADAEFWAPGFAYGDLRRAPALDVTIGGRRYGIYMRDWRVSPPMDWLDLMGERELRSTPPPPPEQEASPVVMLAESDFAEAVRAALRHFTEPLALRANPLTRSRLVVDGAADDPAEALAARIRLAAESLRRNPRQLKLYRALHHTYLQPAETQERAAELIGAPFSTYRRHLKQGVDLVVALLWDEELRAAEQRPRP